MPIFVKENIHLLLLNSGYLMQTLKIVLTLTQNICITVNIDLDK